MNPILRNTQLFVKRNASTILTCIGGVGVIGTAISAAKCTPKALLLLEEAKEEKGEELTKVEKIQVAAVAYIPTIVIGASTLVCIFGANILDRRQQASLMSAYALLESSYKDYRNKVKELYGEEADGTVKKELAKDIYEEIDIPTNDDKELFFDFYSLRYFEYTMADIYKADDKLNQMLIKYGFVSLGEFYEFLGLETTPANYNVGWSVEGGGLFYGYSWIDFEHDICEVDDGLKCCCISFEHDPDSGFNTW